MIIRSGSMIAAAGALLLSGCANWDVDGTAAMPSKGDAFAKALHKEYIERAKFEVKEQDWISVDFFTGRAKLAAEGAPPAPQMPADRKLQKDVPEIGAGYKQLTASLAAGAAKVSPAACAKSQAWLEHWMEQAEEGHQAADIAWTRGEFMKAIPDCVATKPVAFHIYFPFNSAALTKEARAVVADIVSLFKAEKPKAVNVAGHTDTSGNPALNMKLGMKRADAVSKALAAKGVKSVKATSYGETNLPKPTPDNIKEQQNRQVVVTFTK
jgi:outer membrane protein OmpA-like peptidoglycan-associated protein